MCMLMEQEREQGRKEGRTEGLLEGRKEGRMDAVLSLIEAGYSEKSACEILKTDYDEFCKYVKEKEKAFGS